MAPHSSTLAWKLPWTEEPGRLQSMGSLRVGHDSVTSLSCTGEKHIVLCIHFQYPAPKVRQAGDLWWDRAYHQPPGLGLPEASPSPGSSPYCVMLCLFQYSHYVPIALTLGYWGPPKYRKESFLVKSLFSVQSPNSSPRE